MSRKWAYCLAVLCLPVLRFGVLDAYYDPLLQSWGYGQAAQVIATLRANPTYREFMGNWALPFFAACMLVYWITADDDSAIPMQFLFLPIFYIPFSIIGAVLMHAEFRPEYLWVHPLVVLPFGFLYTAFWTCLVWGCAKLRLLD